MKESWKGPLEKIDNHRWQIPSTYKQGMKAPGMIYADDVLIEGIRADRAPEQVANAAFLPGIVKYSLAMPDIHWGYGLPIGGVVATDPKDGGVVTPGGIGYDINCGVRLIRSELTEKDVRPGLKSLVAHMFGSIPAGVGSEGKIRVSQQEEKKILTQGAAWAVKKGFGNARDLDFTEDKGCLEGADPGCISERAYERGKKQSGTLGSGNHFIEIQSVEDVYDENMARFFRLEKGAVTIMIHTGSRGFGYQVCDDYSKSMIKILGKYKINVPDKQLSCAPLNSEEGKAYIAAMKCAANYAWANRQCLMHLARGVFENFFNDSASNLGLDLIYDVAHNIGKFERHGVNGESKTLFVHRKGATRAFGPGREELPIEYKQCGQPVIIPGDMGTGSYLLVGTKEAEESTFGSSCHGAGRVLSRKAAINKYRGRSIKDELEKKGIHVMAAGRSVLSEEGPEAYKDINAVVKVVVDAGIAKKVCRMKPLAVVKG
jgi:tRNA-splicing ligase RtcB